MKETGSGQEQKDAADASLMVPALDPPSTDTFLMTEAWFRLQTLIRRLFDAGCPGVPREQKDPAGGERPSHLRGWTRTQMYLHPSFPVPTPCSHLPPPGHLDLTAGTLSDDTNLSRQWSSTHLLKYIHLPPPESL